MSKRCPKRYRDLLWFRIRWGSSTWRVLLSCYNLRPKELSGGLGKPSLCGLCLYEERTILINVDKPRWLQDITLLHEISHLALEEAEGISRWTEERLVEALDKPLWTILKRHGLKWPKRPAGSLVLEQYARREAREREKDLD